MDCLNSQLRTVIPDISVYNDWHKGRLSYCVWMYRLRGDTLLDFTDKVLTSVAGAVDTIAISNLHMTVFVSGFCSFALIYNDDILTSTLERQVEMLRGQKLYRPKLQITGVAVCETAIYLQVTDLTDSTRGIRDLLGEGAQEVIFGDFIPHITVAHYLSQAPLADVARRLTQWHVLSRPLEITDVSLELVSVPATAQLAPGVGLCSDMYETLYCHPWGRE